MKLQVLDSLLRYGDWANERILRAAANLPDDKLDAPFDMGLGTLRRTLIHILAGEAVWIERWQGRAETPWPDQNERLAVAEIADRLRATHQPRDAFLASINAPELGRSVTYRDSLGERYAARLEDMLLQLCIHSAHHRAQAVNMLRRLGADAPELDYMYWVRKPANAGQ
jgi:uncharacterized damage-inducible protein DinB